MKRTIFLHEPLPDKYGRIKELYTYTREDLNHQKYYCNEYTADVYKAENTLMDILDLFPIRAILRREIEKAIEDYAEAIKEEARESAEDNFYERQAGASL
jgi:predicted ArsR family transcriptional regulator